MRGNQTHLLLTLAALLGFWAAGCQQEQPAEAPMEQQQLIILGGPILTMAGAEPTYAEAVAVRDGLITFVGSEAGDDSPRPRGTRTVAGVHRRSWSSQERRLSVTRGRPATATRWRRRLDRRAAGQAG